MLTKALVLTDGEADLLSRVLEEVKTKTFEESKISLDDVGALNALISHFCEAENLERGREARQLSVNPLGKRLFLGHIIGREGSTDTGAARGKHEAGFLDIQKDKELLQKSRGLAINHGSMADELESELQRKHKGRKQEHHQAFKFDFSAI